MIRIFKYIILMIMTILMFIQIFCIKSTQKVNNIKVYNTQNKSYDDKTLKQISEELDCLEEKTILSANQTDSGKWYVKLKIIGNKDELINEISKLKNYDIINYTINKNKDESYIIIDIGSRESI